jgi:serine protein kinase
VGDARAILERISKAQNFEGYRQEHWHGTFDEYLDIVRKDPRVTRSAYQRLYDMILSYGVTPVEGNKDGLVRYRQRRVRRDLRIDQTANGDRQRFQERGS